MDKRLLELNGITEQVKGQEINKAIRKNDITISNELALLRKEILHIEEALNITPTTEFSEYNNKINSIKSNIEEEA